MAVVIGAFIGHCVATWTIFRQVSKLINELNDDNSIEVVRVPILKPEQVGDTICFYDQNDCFVCQGSNLTEAAANAYLVGIKVAVFEWQDTQQWFAYGQVGTADNIQELLKQ